MSTTTIGHAAELCRAALRGLGIHKVIATDDQILLDDGLVTITRAVLPLENGLTATHWVVSLLGRDPGKDATYSSWGETASTAIPHEAVRAAVLTLITERIDSAIADWGRDQAHRERAAAAIRAHRSRERAKP